MAITCVPPRASSDAPGKRLQVYNQAAWRIRTDGRTEEFPSDNQANHIVDRLLANDAKLRDGCDVLIGGKGKDRLVGGGGKDLVDGGTGRNWLAGGPGNDLLFGRRHCDLFHGSNGRDRTMWLPTAADLDTVFELARFAAKYYAQGNRSAYFWPAL